MLLVLLVSNATMVLLVTGSDCEGYLKLADVKLKMKVKKKKKRRWASCIGMGHGMPDSDWLEAHSHFYFTLIDRLGLGFWAGQYLWDLWPSLSEIINPVYKGGHLCSATALLKNTTGHKSVRENKEAQPDSYDKSEIQ